MGGKWSFKGLDTHGSGTGDGHAHAVIKLTIDYDLVAYSLACDTFDITLPDLDLELKGGGAWHPIVHELTGTIEKVVKSAVPDNVNPVVCPTVNKLALRANECADTAAK